MKPNDIEILLLRPDEVVIDRDHWVQREFRESHARNIARDYSVALFGLGHVSLRSDGKYYLMDGQHRCAAALMAGMGHIPVAFQIWRGLSIEQEAEKFIKFQQKRVAVGAFDRFRVGVTARNPVNLEIVRILETYGLSYGVGSAEGTISAVDALVQIYEGKVRGVPLKKGPKQKPASPLPQGHLLSRTLNVLTQAWGRERQAFDGVLLRGVAALLYKHDAKIEGARLAKLLAKKSSPARCVGKIRSLKESARISGAAAAVQVLEGIYNIGLSEDKKL